MLYTTNTNSLMFSLPCLSPKEAAYVQLQVATVQAHSASCAESSFDELKRRGKMKPKAKLNPRSMKIVSSHLLMERCLAIAEAYQVEDRVLPNFIKLCEEAVVPRNFKTSTLGETKFNMMCLKPFQLQNGLEMGEMMGGSSMWLELAMKNKYRYERTFSALCNQEEFHLRYKKRLIEVMDSLGLSELEHLVEDLDQVGNGKLSLAEYSQHFYDKVLLELCGVSNLSDRLLSRSYTPAILPYLKDPVNLLRTYYILHKVLDFDLDMNVKNIALLERLTALDLLTTLNMLGQGLFLDKDMDTRKEMIISGAEQCQQLFLENQFIWTFPVSHCIKLMYDIGFTEEEVDQLTKIQKENKKAQGVLWCLNHRLHEFNLDRSKFVDVMKKRLYLLRNEGDKLGIPSITLTYLFMINWEKAVMAIDKAELGNSQFFIWFRWDESVVVGVYPVLTKITSASRAYLLDYFGLKKNIEEIKKFDDMFLRMPYAKDVPLRLLVGSLMYLESLGFSKEQIKKGYPIMCYSPSILSEYIPKVEAVLGPEWMEKDNALCLLNYFIEVEQKFSYELIYTGMLDCYEEGLSEEFFSSLVTQSRPAQPGHLLAARTPSTAGASRSFHTTSCLRQGRDEGLRTRKIKIFHIQNPLTWLKIFLKFREIKQQWDPHLDQEDFTEGAKYAVEAITSKLEQGEWKELRGLLSRKEFKRLRKEVETEWSDVMRQNVSLEVDQMVKVLITDIRTQQIVDNKFCDIDVMVMGVKEQERKTPLVMQLEVRLHREYTEGCLPDWVVTRFRLKNWDKSVQAGNI